MRVLLTRPAADSARIAREWEAMGARCLVWPLTRIVAATDRLDVPAEAEALLFTSPNAVRLFAAMSPRRDLPVLAVGERTAELVRQAGFAQVTSAAGDAQDLVRLAQASGFRRFLHPRGRDVAGDPASALFGAGLVVEAPVLYAAEPAGAPDPAVTDAFGRGGFEVVTVWSPRNAAILHDWLSRAAPPLDRTDLLGISENAVAPLRHAGFRRIAVAARPDATAMTAWICAALRK